MENKLKLEERRQKILDILHQNGKVSVAAISRELGTTPVTIRSDLTALEQEGHLIRVQGGAVLPPRNKGIQAVPIVSNVEEKKRIASTVAGMICDGDTLFINSGTTTEYVATALEIRANLNIVTNSLAVATILGEIPSFRVILVGGEINAQYGFTYGGDALSQLEKYNAHWAILSIDGISTACGITTRHAEEAIVDRTMIANASNTLIVADHSKIERAGFARVRDDLEGITVVTDSSNTDELASAGMIIINV